MRPRLHVGIAPTPRDTVRRLGAGRLLRFRGRRPATGPTVLLVPSLIHRWYVLDLRTGASLVEALVDGGLDVWCYDWGLGADEDRFVGWDDLVARLHRVIRWVRRDADTDRVALLGHSMGATLAAIATALQPGHVSALVNLTGPVDFAPAKIGASGHLVDRRWFDVDAITGAGNVSPLQLRAGFVTLRPTVWWHKARELLQSDLELGALRAVGAREWWVADGVAFPAAAYRRYIEDLYRANALVRGEHRVAGRAVDLRTIECPVLVAVGARDEVCPPDAALALLHAVGSEDVMQLTVPGGHVDALIGPGAREALYPALTDWLRTKP